MTILGVAQTPKDSCSIPKDSLCQVRNSAKMASAFPVLCFFPRQAYSL